MFIARSGAQPLTFHRAAQGSSNSLVRDAPPREAPGDEVLSARMPAAAPRYAPNRRLPGGVRGLALAGMAAGVLGVAVLAGCQPAQQDPVQVAQEHKLEQLEAQGYHFRTYSRSFGLDDFIFHSGGTVRATRLDAAETLTRLNEKAALYVATPSGLNERVWDWGSLDEVVEFEQGGEVFGMSPSDQALVKSLASERLLIERDGYINRPLSAFESLRRLGQGGGVELAETTRLHTMADLRLATTLFHDQGEAPVDPQVVQALRDLGANGRIRLNSYDQNASRDLFAAHQRLAKNEPFGVVITIGSYGQSQVEKVDSFEQLEEVHLRLQQAGQLPQQWR
ncbi:MAG: hypothetical protein AB7S38_18080 [Vulcanimicrobiota bacterium]